MVVCFLNEYGWGGSVSQSSDDTAEAILHVSFDHGAQRLFSSVHIRVCCSPTAQDLLEKYHLDPQPPFRVPSPLLGNAFDGRNPSSLPVFNAVFRIDRSPSGFAFCDITGKQTLKQDPEGDPCPILLEINQPLTANTQNVSFAFTHSKLLYTPGPHGTGRHFNGSLIVGSTVRIQPVVLFSDHKAIFLPTEILLMIFENLADLSQVYKWWRRDLLSCALVCKQWTCALDLLLSDFRYPSRHENSPEICRLANALALRPSLGLSITHLSPHYFLTHASWKNCHMPQGSSRPIQLGNPFPHDSDARLEQFLASFSSILRLAKDLRSLSLSWDWSTDLPDELLDSLRGLDKLEEVSMRGVNSPHQIYPYLAMWPTLKRLKMGPRIYMRTVPGPIPTSPPEYALTEVTLGMAGDEHLNYILSSSSSSLERLTIRDVFLTNGGLHTALLGVARSLVMLHIDYRVSLWDENEERALDSIVVQMERLKTLHIDLELATNQMIIRRADAFKSSRMLGSRAALPVIELTIDQSRYAACPDNSLVIAAACVWPGWEIKISRPLRDTLCMF